MIKKKCSNPLCSQMIPRGKQPPYCEDHDPTAKTNKHYDLYQRDERSKKFYDSQNWRRLRKTVLSEYFYLCQTKLDDCDTIADTVHHIVEVRDDWSKRFERNNLSAICRSCHNEIHK